jgi:hypothetical protein
MAAANERTELQFEVEALKEEFRTVESQAEALHSLRTPLPLRPPDSMTRSGSSLSQQHSLGSWRALSPNASGEETLRAALIATESREEHAAAENRRLQAGMAMREAETLTLRTELRAEMAAVRRAYHRSEEQQLRHQAQIEHTQQHAARCEAQAQELRAALRARDESFEERVSEALKAAAGRETAEVARAEARLRSEVGEEREALYARVREQLVGLTSLKASPSRSPSRVSVGRSSRNAVGQH